VTGGRLSGRTATVTGSTKGIGLGIARASVREVAVRHLGVTVTAPLFPGFTMNPLKYPGVLV